MFVSILNPLFDAYFSTSKLNEKWVADITYIHTLHDGWCYLATILDLYSKKIIRYSFSRSMTTELVLYASRQCRFCSTAEILASFCIHIFGSQYTSEDFSQALKEQEIIPSFSSCKGCPDHRKLQNVSNLFMPF